MPLPVSSAPLPPDVASTGWAPITIRVAWILVRHGIRVTHPVLRDAREHVLLHLDPATPVERAEDVAEHLCSRFVRRARRQPADGPWDQDAAMPLSPRWRRALERSLSPLSAAVFKQHYGDGRPVSQLEPILGVDGIAIEAARAGLREVVRRAGTDDGLPFDQWPAERLDVLLARLAGYVDGTCPSMLEVVEGCHARHAATCPRCDRAVRLVAAGVLGTDDLIPPVLSARPDSTASVLALHFHPDARHHRFRLAREAGVTWFPVGDDVVLLDAEDRSKVIEITLLAAEVGAPSRDHLRGAVLTGPGRWSRHGLLGPLADEAAVQVRTRPWGSVDGMGDLPAELPPAPSARGWWAGVGALGLAAAAALYLALVARPGAVPSLDAAFVPARGGVWADFDADDAAIVSVVRETDGRLEVLGSAAGPADKAAWATGDGRYRLHVLGDGVLVAATREPLDLPGLFDDVGDGPDRLGDLAHLIETSSPGAEARWGRR